MNKKKRTIGVLVKILMMFVLVTNLLGCQKENSVNFAKGGEIEAKQDRKYDEYNLLDCPYPSKFSSKRSKTLKQISRIKDKLYDREECCFIDTKKEYSEWGTGDIENKHHFKKTLDYSEFIYVGKLKKNEPNGKGILLRLQDNDAAVVIYAGEFKEGYFDGYGMLFQQDGYSNLLGTIHAYYLAYEGEFKKGIANGEGIIYYTPMVRSEKYETWRDEQDVRGGEKISIDLEVPVIVPRVFAIGDINKGRLDGQVKIYQPALVEKDPYYLPVGGLSYDGHMKDNKYDGKGTLYYNDGTVKYKGEWRNDKYSGKGTLYNEDGSIKHKGKFKKGDVK